MTSLQLQRGGRTALDVPWDVARERRVLGRALETRRRRARRRLTLELTAAMALLFVAGRVLSGISVDRGEARRTLTVPASELDAKAEERSTAPHSESAAKKTPNRALGGFAGTGGHGGAGSNGHGGSAGTG
jgi:hypothetical protein